MNYGEYSKKTKDEILKKFDTSENGLKNEEVKNRLNVGGKNISSNVKKHGPLYFIINSFKDKFILILLVLAVIDYISGDTTGTWIIIGISVASAMLRFSQDYSTYRFNEKLRAKLKPKCDVIRNGNEIEVLAENIVKGDIVTLGAGSVIPADLYMIETKDLYVNQGVFTGESVPIEKKVKIGRKTNFDEIFDIPNIAFQGSNVVSGDGVGVVIATGQSTYMGSMNKELNTKRAPTNFENGMSKITNLLIRFMVVISVLVFAIYGFIRKDLTEALLFALSVAVGITPSMLPMIVNVNLTRGSKNLAKQKTLVKNIQSIQNIGSMDTLCTDKTGTLTLNNIVLQKYLDCEGNEDKYVLKCAYLNSSLSTGFKNIVDKAVIAYGKQHEIPISNYKKVDEIPFDYMRKRASIVVQDDEKNFTMITKGALEEILKISTKCYINGKSKEISKKDIETVESKANELAKQGMQVLALATRNSYPWENGFTKDDESQMTLIGIIAFLDPPKKDARGTLNKLKKYGVTTKVLTGDNQYSTGSICKFVGIDSDILLGTDIDKMNDHELSKAVEEYDIFARLNPMQKERVVKTLKSNGHVVGYMGDGVNDAQSLKASDVGISVKNATDIAKEASDIILLERSLNVIFNGVIQGRIVYGNIIKYMKLALSSDFGDVFSILIASIFIPFLPLLPIQMLMQDFIFEISQIAIPFDTVEENFLKIPRKWDTKDLGKFMVILGVVSSITDVISFILFWFVLGYNSVEMQSYFQTAWFVQCLISETLIIYYIRTPKIPFIQSKPSKALFTMTLITFFLTIVSPIILHPFSEFHFEILPPIFYLFVVILCAIYALIVQTVKHIYIKKYHEWL